MISGIHETQTYGMKWSLDNTKLAIIQTDLTYEDGEEIYVNDRLHLLDSSGRQILLTINQNIGNIAWKPEADEFVSVDSGSNIRRWNSITGEMIATYQHTSASMLPNEYSSIPAVNVAYNSTGTVLASCGLDNAIRFWDIETGTLINAVELGRPVTIGLHEAVSWVGWNSNNSMFAATNWDYYLRIWHTTNEKIIHKLFGHTGAIVGGAWSPDDSKIATASMDHTVRVWDALSGENLIVLQGHTDWVSEVCWSPDGKHLASAGGDGTVRIWNSENGQQIKLIQASDVVAAMDWATDGRLAYAPRIVYGRDVVKLSPTVIILPFEATLNS